MNPRPGRLRRFLRSAVAVAAATLFGGVVAAPAQAVPAFGEVPLVVLGCRFADDATQPPLVNTLRTLVRGPGDSLNSRVRALSGNHASLTKADVRGWYGMPLRAADRPSTPQVGSACRAAATTAGVSVPTTARLLVVVNTGDYRPETTEPYGTVINASQPLAAWQHQLGHVLGLADAWSWDPATTSDYRRADDEFSMMGAFRQPFPRILGNARPTLNAFELDRLSWLDQSRIVTAGADGQAITFVDLAPVDPSAFFTTPGPQLVRVPFDRFDPEHYYTVEVRAYAGDIDTPVEYGGGLLIHEIRNGIPILLRDNTIPDELDGAQLVRPGRPPLQSLSRNGVQINVVATTGVPFNTIRIAVVNPTVTQCLAGFSPRLARSQDRVCVTGDRVTATAEANRLAPTRWVAGPFGLHTCVTGFVWREAFAGDDVCVTPAERGVVADENRTAAGRANPTRLTIGPNGCSAGYVWREADRFDHVCVVPARRAEVAAELVKAPCPTFTYLRLAWPADPTCSTVASRSLVADENTVAPSRVARP